MHIKQIECFVNLAETLNFSRTAENLFITQPTVTHQINTLEDELDIKLLIRTKRKVQLTHAGLSFYNDMKEILTRTNIAIVKAKHFSHIYESNLSIGYEGNIEVKQLPEILKIFNDKYPHVHIYLKIADFREKRNLFSSHDFDLIFAVKESVEDLSEIGFSELFVSKFVCVMLNDHPLAKKCSIELTDLNEASLILLDPQKCPTEMARVQKNIQFYCPRAPIFFSDHPLITHTMIKGNLGIAVMPDFVCPADPDLAIIPMSIEDSISYGIAWHKKNTRKEINGFVSISKKIYATQYNPAINEK